MSEFNKLKYTAFPLMFVHFTDYCIISHFAKKIKNLGGLRLTHIEYLHSVHKLFHLFQQLIKIFQLIRCHIFTQTSHRYPVQLFSISFLMYSLEREKQIVIIANAAFCLCSSVLYFKIKCFEVSSGNYDSSLL